MKKEMSANQLYHYRKFRACGAACILCLAAITCVGIFFTVALMYHMPKTAIGLACLEVLILFICQVNCSDADKHYKRAFPDDNDESPFRL